MEMSTNKKMQMSLDDIIRQEKLAKTAVRNGDIHHSDRSMDEESVNSGDMQQVSIELPAFRNRYWSRRFPFFTKRPPIATQRQWLHHRYINRNLAPFHIPPMKRRDPGIPLLALKKGFLQGVFGNTNYRIKHWRPIHSLNRNSAFCGGRGRGRGRFQPASSPLTTQALNRFNRSNSPAPGSFKRGPGSAYSGCSGSCTSYRSYRSNGSRSFKSGIYFGRFQCLLNVGIQKEIRQLQQNKDNRISNSPRVFIKDQATQCQPIVRATNIPLNHRFKSYCYPVDLD